VEDCPKGLIKESQELRNALSTADGREWVKRLLAKYGTTQVSPVIAMGSEPQCDAAEFARLALEFDHNRTKFLQWVKPYDLVICPANATPAEPWPAEPRWNPQPSGNYGYTTTYNSTSPEGLPIGVQLITKPWREDISLAAAAFVEAGTGGYQKPAI
jgi:amidase